MKPDSSKERVYIAYGIAMNSVQECELTLIQTYYSIKLVKGKIRSEEDKTSIYSKALGNTFGTLINNLKGQNYLKPELLFKVDQIKSVRDNLAHTFFKECMEELKSESGRRKIIEGLEFYDSKITELCNDLNEVMEWIFKKLNFSNQEIEDFTDNNTRQWIEKNKNNR